jgi:hypothetical protein
MSKPTKPEKKRLARPGSALDRRFFSPDAALTEAATFRITGPITKRLNFDAIRKIHLIAFRRGIGKAGDHDRIVKFFTEASSDLLPPIREVFAQAHFSIFGFIDQNFILDETVNDANRLIEVFNLRLGDGRAKFHFNEILARPGKLHELHLRLVVLEAALHLAESQGVMLKEDFAFLLQSSQPAAYSERTSHDEIFRHVRDILIDLVSIRAGKDSYDGAKNSLPPVDNPYNLKDIEVFDFKTDEKTLSEEKNRQEILNLIDAPLNQAFDLVSFPIAQRSQFVEKIVNELLVHQVEFGTWAQRISEGFIPDAQPSMNQASAPSEILPPQINSESRVQPDPLPEPKKLERIAVPQGAPAIWRDDKQPGDTPPDFIKRHYGPFLRADATGLTRADVRRLDSSLYMALANWLRKNELPSDCPLPHLSDRVDAELKNFSFSDANVSSELPRLAAALYRRSQVKDRSS